MQRIIRMRKSILVVMMVVFLMSILPLTILMQMIYRVSLSSIQQSLNESLQSETQVYANRMNEDVTNIRVQLYECLTNSTVSALTFQVGESSVNSQYIQKVWFVQSYLAAKQTSTPMLEGLRIFFPKHSKVLSSSSLVNVSPSEAENLSVMLMENDGFASISDGKLRVWAGMPYTGNDSFSEYTVFVMATITEANLAKRLREYIQEDSLTELMLVNEATGTPFASTFSQGDFGDLSEILLAAHDDGGHSMEHTWQGERYLVTWSSVSGSGFTLYQINSLSQSLARLTAYQRTMMAYQGVAFTLSACLMLLLYAAIYRPIRQTRNALKSVEGGDFGVRLPSSPYAEFDDMNRQFNSMADHIKNLIEREYTLRLLHSRAELKQLQNQISPHFLYNTYFTLRTLLVEEEYEQATGLADVMGRYLRYITVTGRETATLADEIGHARAYAQIQQMRFSKRVTIDFGECPEGFWGVSVPAIIIQPLIENAFEHGVRGMVEGGRIVVSFTPRSEDALEIAVQDNGPGATEETLAHIRAMLADESGETAGESVALYNIHRRLHILGNERCGLSVSRGAMGGLRCAIHIERGTRDVPPADH